MGKDHDKTPIFISADHSCDFSHLLCPFWAPHTLLPYTYSLSPPHPVLLITFLMKPFGKTSNFFFYWHQQRLPHYSHWGCLNCQQNMCSKLSKRQYSNITIAEGFRLEEEARVEKKQHAFTGPWPLGLSGRVKVGEEKAALCGQPLLCLGIKGSVLRLSEALFFGSGF